MSQLEFRDGKREVPEYLEPLLRRLETHKLRYEEAVLAANELMLRDYINAQHDQIVAAHFRGSR